MNIQRSRTVAPRIVLILSLLLCPLEATAAVDGALRDRMSHVSGTETLPVIVTFADQVATDGIIPLGLRGIEQRRELVRRLRDTAERSQKPLRDFLRGRGVERVRPLWIKNALAFEATPELVEILAAWPGVASVTLDGTVSLPEVLPAQAGAAQWNIEVVRAPDLWDLGLDGTGVVVATLDTGVDPLHPAMTANRRANASWFNPYAANCAVPGVICSTCDASADLPCDSSGHGTGVMGVAVGAGGIGVAPGAQWIAAKIFPDAGEAPYSAITEAFQWVLDPNGDGATDDAPDIVNNSWGLGGGTECLTEFRTEIQTLKTAGIAVVFAAGNTAAFVTSPANYPESVAVGMVDQSNLIDPLSSRGPSPCDPQEPFPELVAPGVQIRTADLTLSGTVQNPYQTISGTSFSAPHVSGVLALLLDAFPGLSSAALETTLYSSAVDLGAAGPDNIYGYGLVNAFNAFEALSGNPVVSLHDPVVPADDGILPFGNIPPGTIKDLSVTVTNAGGGVLTITSVGGAGLVAPFSLFAENCSGADLVSGQSCTVTLRFAPESHDEFTSTLEIISSPAASPVALIGSGNTAPVAPLLVFPVSGASVERPVTLGWVHPGDADGDPVTDEVVISTSPHLASTLPRSLPGGTGAILAGFGLAGALFLRRRFPLAGSAALLVLLAFLLSCGGGGGTAPPPLTADRTFVATDLAPATTYYWKIVSSDGFGGSSQSAIWSFTTR
ncbi:S8 family serine peptidase [Desulfuromonas soudanensis]|nr:S8 family serine peptidase [Desulfuromonas soudanensis]